MSNEQKIFEAAYSRLKLHFSDRQATLLGNLMVAQSKWESGGYKSNVFLKNNNAFGYTVYAGSAYQIGAGTSNAAEKLTYGKYANFADSAKEVADWLGRPKRVNDFAMVQNCDDYAAYLKKYGYYTAPQNTYAGGLKMYFNGAPLLSASAAARLGGILPVLLLVAASAAALFFIK